MTRAAPRHAEILIVGAGPAGLAAATAAAQTSAQVIILDDNPNPGGQIWRKDMPSATTSRDSARDSVLRDLSRSQASLLSGRRVIDAPQPHTLRAFVEATGNLQTFTWDRLILATGARERFLPFPGWTLPGIFGVGGLQALVKSGYSVSGKRVIVAGTGPLLLAVAAHLQEYGAHVVLVAEQASLHSLLRFTPNLCSHPTKLLQALRYRTSLRRTPCRTGCWPVAAEGTDRVTAVCLTDGRTTWDEPCDLLACGFHLVPNTELAALLGCRFAGEFVAVDSMQQTSLQDIYCVGESTSIAGVDAALIQGKIAGLAATNKTDDAKALFNKRDREQAFGKGLDLAFALRQELRSLSQPDTIVCRCEDVSYSQLQLQLSWTDAKLQTRCGMGPCQGRICGPAVQTLFGWRNTAVRPPIFPVPLSALLSAATPTSSDITQLQETL